MATQSGAGSASGEVQGGQPGGRLPATLWLKVLFAFGVAAIAVALVPRGTADGEVPPIRTLLLTGSLVAAITTVALFAGIRADLRLPTRVAVYAVGYNALVVLVKFVLAPRGLWQVNRSVDLTAFFPPDETVGAILTGAFVLVLYLTALWLIYRLARRRIEGLARLERRQRPKTARRIVLPVVVGALLLAGTGGALVLIPLALVSSGLEYLDFVFSSAVSALIGVALAGASALAFMAFGSTADRAAVLGDAMLLTSLFWVGLCFLALYHALWVVYILVLTTIWPLRVVVPK